MTDLDTEVVDAVPVLAGPRAIEPRRAAPVAVQAAAVAASSFVAGAATIALFKRRRSLGLGARRSRTPHGKVLTTRSFLVDVHLLDRK